MSRSLPTWSVRRADGHSDSAAGCGEERFTTVTIGICPLNDKEK